MTKFVVIGGDAAGMSAASKAKREDPELDVVVFERGDWVAYGACGLPYYVKGEVESLEDLVAVEPEEFIDERGIDLRLHHEVTSVDPEDETVTVESPDGDFEETYDYLLISTGARAIVPPIDGTELDGVFTMQSMSAGGDVRGYVETEEPDSVAVVGGGYIGMEMSEALSAHADDVHVFEMLPHVLAPFGDETAEVVEDHLREKGVELHLGTAVQRLDGDGTLEAVVTEDGRVGVDMVVVGVGVTPNAELASDAGIRLGETGAVATDEYGRTNYDNVFAAGDCAEAENAVTGKPDHVPLALTANRHGRAVGQTVAGSPTPTGPIVGTALTKVFELEVARTGIVDEENARDEGFEPVSATVTAGSRAHYYPDGKEIKIKMVGDADSGRLLGASLVGREGVSKRVDTVATALHSRMTVSDFERLDLAYAPPFSPVWDPLLTAAKVLNGKMGD